MSGCANVATACASPVLRPYQEATISTLLERLRSGRRAPLVVLPTAGGKTVVMSAVIARHLARAAAPRVLLVAHRRELINQISQTLRRSGIDVAEIHPDAPPPSGAARVFVASVQTLLARGVTPDAITLLIFDEAHHYSADDWSTLIETCPGAIRIGFTATPSRSDGRGMAPAFDSLVVGATIGELTKAGYLVPCRVIAPERPLYSRELAQEPVDAYLEHAAGRRTVVFAEFVADAIAFRDAFVARGIDAVVVHGELGKDERSEALRAHCEDGAVLVNVAVLTEGWDSPETAVCILARGCGSVGTYLQIVGRILRPADAKTEALLIDLTGRAFFTHGAPDEERVFSLDGRGIRRKNGREGATCFVCGCVVDGWPCGVCGHVPSGEKLEPLRVVGGDLAERYAEKRAEDDAKKIETLARWIAETDARGWQMRSVFRKFAYVYGSAPSSAIVSAAYRASHDIACVDCTSCGRASAKTYRDGKCGRCAFGAQKGAA